VIEIENSQHGSNPVGALDDDDEEVEEDALHHDVEPAGDDYEALPDGDDELTFQNTTSGPVFEETEASEEVSVGAGAACSRYSEP
jgi:hypothetical protein